MRAFDSTAGPQGTRCKQQERFCFNKYVAQMRNGTDDLMRILGGVKMKKIQLSATKDESQNNVK